MQRRGAHCGSIDCALSVLAVEARADGWLYWSLRASGGIGSSCAATPTTAQRRSRRSLRVRSTRRAATSIRWTKRSTGARTPPNASVQQAPFTISGADSLATDEATGLLYVAQPSAGRILRCPVSDCDEVSDLVEVVTGQSSIGGKPLKAADVQALAPNQE